MPLDADPQADHAGKALNFAAPPVAGPALLSLNVYRICRRHLPEGGAVQ